MRTARLNGFVVILVAILAMLFASGASAEIPRKINYQARLTDIESGDALRGARDMIFRIYDAAEGGSELWSESATVQVDSAGVFSVVLGTMNPLDLAFDGPVWLEVEVGGETLSPRREMVAVPYAFRATDCASLAGIPSDSYWTADNDGAGSGLDADKLDGYEAQAFSDTGHVHDDRYVHRDSLGMAGVVNSAGNPVDWTRLKGVPGGFADGVDDVGSADDGHSLDAADGEPVDALYVDNEGYVGIGTTTPTERLHLVGASSRILLQGAAEDPEIGLSSTIDPPEDVWRIYKDRGSGSLRFAQDGDRVSIAFQTGNVGIGTAPGADRLVVDGSVSVSEHLKMDGATVFSLDGTANTFVGREAGVNNTGSSNTFVGEEAGYLNGLGTENVFVGDSTGYSNTQGFYNVFVGHASGLRNTTGQDNAFIGALTGKENGIGSWNTFVGSHAGAVSADSYSNTFVGSGAGSNNVSGSDNTYIGNGTGGLETTGSMNTCLGSFTGPGGDGSGNVLIGYMAGLNSAGSDELYIANGPQDDDVLIYGDFSTGNVGLGTLDPTRRLHVTSPSSIYGMLVLENSNTGDNEASIGFRPGIDAGGTDTWVAGVGCWGKAGRFVIGKNEPRFTINSQGDVGIGTTNPVTRLEVDASGNCWITSRAYGMPGIGGFGLMNDNTTWQVDVRGDLSDIFAVSNSDFPWYPYLAIDYDGNVGIGSEAPERKVHIKGDNPRVLIEATSAAPEVNFKHTGDTSAEVWAIYKDGTTNDLRFYQGGDKIWIKGSTGNVGLGGNPGTNKLYINGSGCYVGDWESCSDARYKRDIRDVGDALDKVMALRGVSFLWRQGEYTDKNFDSGRHYGVIAQEAEGVLPEVVGEDPDGGKTVAYTEIVPVLIEAIKAQQHEIEDLKQRLAAMEAR
jgi:hypothetical protein